MANELASLSNELAAVVDRAGRSVVAVHARPRFSSSGVFWRPGVIVTAEHTIRREEEITVTLPDGRNVPATLAGTDPGTDIAVLKIDAANQTPGDHHGARPYPALSPSPSGAPRIPARTPPSASSARAAASGAPGAAGGSTITSASTSPSTPGRMAAPSSIPPGETIGIATSALSRIAGLAIPAVTMDRVVDEILARGHVARGYLGVGLQPVELPDHHKGLIVLSLEPAGPAAKAGVLIGDIVVQLGGKAVQDTDDIQRALEGHAVGQSVTVDILARRRIAADRGHHRGASKEQLTCADLEISPSASGAPPCRSFNGATTADARSQGSGIVWNGRRTHLTNAHVARTPEAEIELWDGRRFHARVASRDPRRDLATLRVVVGDGALEPATPGDSTALRPGELVIAVGNPLGFAGALSTGVVHSIGALPGMGGQSWIRADVRLAPGNSGGPLANAEGRVIGINTAIVNGLGVAVPAQRRSISCGAARAPSLGVVLRPVDLGLLLLEVDPRGRRRQRQPVARRHPAHALRRARLARSIRAAPTLRLHFLRGDRTRVREAVVRLTDAVEAAA